VADLQVGSSRLLWSRPERWRFSTVAQRRVRANRSPLPRFAYPRPTFACIIPKQPTSGTPFP